MMKKLVLLFTCAFTFVANSNKVYARNDISHSTKQTIIFNSHWNHNRSHKRCPSRSICYAILGEGYLSFYFISPIENAKIEITKNGVSVFSKNYSKLEDSLEIQLPEFEEGDYVIEITNNDGLDLSGEFTIE